MAPPRPSTKGELLDRSALDTLLRNREEDGSQDLGYLARVMVQATMPHSDPHALRFERSNGQLTVRITALGEGLPYGSLPRLLLAWVTTEAVRTRSPELVLGHTLAAFMRQLDLTPTGGRWGTIPRLRRQMVRLFTSAVSVSQTAAERDRGRALTIATDHDLWWDPQRPEQAALWQSTVVLSTEFFREVVDRPVPIDLVALKALKRSPLALDLYAWLTYRASYLRRLTVVPWASLHLQFGADYGRLRAFRERLVPALLRVVEVYPAIRVRVTPDGLELRPSPTSIAPRRLH